MDGMEQALNPMKYRELSTLHTFDISIPTIEDPAGTRRTLSVRHVHYVPYAPT